MPKFESQISRNDEDFRARSAHHRKLAEDLRAELQRTALGGPEKSRDKHLARGKLLPRERVRTLLDPGSPFLEIAPMAAHGLYDDQAPAAGVIAGIGRIQCFRRLAGRCAIIFCFYIPTQCRQTI